MKFSLFIIATLFHVFQSNSQQTVGLFENTEDAYPGYTLFAPSNNDSTFLIDNCGNVQFVWNSNYKVSGGVYLLESGSLLRTCVDANGSQINGGGAGGRVELINKNQSIEWAFQYSDQNVRLHHDVEPLPNGNVLMIAWEKISQQDAIDAGRNPSLVGGSGLWPDHIIEYNPGLGNIVWEWHAWDHLIQDFDATKPNYGVVADHPELFDLNFDKSNGNGAADWQHMNSVAYNADLDQIMLCSPAWNEIYIIDHSTTTQEAAGHTGGNSGKGGDILWRWGNPERYGAGDASNKLLFGQHDAHWIPNGYPNEGKIVLYNNGKNRLPVEYSSVEIIDPPLLPDNTYEMGANSMYLPLNSDYTYVAPTPTDFYSKIISSADVLPNGNIIIDEGSQGHFFEIDVNENIVWDYVNPAVKDSILAQEQTIPGNQTLQNSVFRVRRIPFDSPAIANLTLSNMGPLERDPYPSTCGLAQTENVEYIDDILVYPTLASDYIYFKNMPIGAVIELIDMTGKKINVKINDSVMDISSVENGVYYLLIKDQQNHLIKNERIIIR